MADARRDEHGNATTLADRLSGRIDAEEMAELRATQKLAFGRTVAVAANGKNPKDWTFERWVAVGTAISMVAGWLFFVGGEWKGVKSDIASIQADVSGVMDGVKRDRQETQQKLDALKVEMERIERADEYFRANGRRPPQFSPMDAQ